MRISANPGDPGHKTYSDAMKRDRVITVTLNGEAISDVVTADEDQGFVVQFERDGDGKPLIDGDGNLVTVSRGGVVQILIARAVQS